MLHQLLGDHQRAIDDLTAVLEYWQKLSDPFCTAETRFLAISQCELGHLDEAGRLLESVFAAVETGWGEREVLRSLAAAAHVLEAAGVRNLAARAIGRADPFQDNFVDTIGTVRARLTDSLGTSMAEALVVDGAVSELAELVTEVRAALAALAIAGRE